ncbi:prion-inhibition and propagation domain-containing protein [Trichoderma sp. SZMC 28014]
MDATSNAITIFQFILDSFSLIQLAREFEDEFERYQLKLDIIQLRISRWGQVSGFIHGNDDNSAVPDSVDSGASKPPPKNDTGSVEDPTQNLAKETLIAIRDTVVKAKRDAKRMKTGLTPSTSQLLEPESLMPPDLKGMRNRIMRIIDKRRVQKNKVVDGMKWAFYKRDHFNTFIADVTSLTDELEKFASAESTERLQNVSSEECQGLNKPNLEELRDIAEGCDPWLEKAVEKALTLRRSAATYTIMQSYNTGMVTGVHHGRSDVKGMTNGNNNTVNNNWARV